MDNKKLLTVQEVAQILRLSDVTVRRYIARRMIKAKSFSKGYRITSEELKRFIRES